MRSGGVRVRRRATALALVQPDPAFVNAVPHGACGQGAVLNRSSVFRRAAVPAAVVSFCWVLGLPAQAQDAVTITATRVSTRLNDVVADISVIDRTMLDRMQGRTLAEVLSSVAGLQFASNGGLGKSSSVFIRGLEARHTLLLVDGVNVRSATLGTPSLDNLPMEAIDRIEIVRGPMSSLYGNGALGGVIQVFTRQGQSGLAGNARLVAGSNRYAQASGGVGFGNGVIDAVVQVEHTATEGVSATNPKVPFGSFNDDRDGVRQGGATVRLGWQAAKDWRLELTSLQSNSVTKIDDGPGADARAELQTRLLALSVQGKVLSGWGTRVVVSDAIDGYDTLSSASPFSTLGVIQSRARQASWENTVASPLGTVLALLETTREKVSRPGQPFALSERDINAAALGLSGAAQGHAWQASVRRDSNSQFGSVTTGALGYGYNVSPAWRATASYGTSQTLPSFNQLYFPNFGNPNLLPEKGQHGEVGVRWTGGEHSVRASYYDYHYRGFISSGPAPVNLPRVDITGVTLAYEGRWRELDLTASLDSIDPVNATVGNANYGKQLARRAKQAARLGADWRSGAWSVGATAAGFSHRFDNAANTLRLAGYGTLDLRADWAVTRDLKLGVKVNNVADKTYETVLGYNQPGRQGFVSLRYAFR